MLRLTRADALVLNGPPSTPAGPASAKYPGSVSFRYDVHGLWKVPTLSGSFFIAATHSTP